MKNVKTLTLGMCFLTIFSGFTFTSCSTKQGTGTLVGAGGGAALGSIIGAIAGHGKGAAIGAAIGGAVGAGAGTLIGKHMDKVAQQTAQVENAQVEEVTDNNGLKAVKVTFDSGILFPTNGYTLNTASKTSLAKFSQVLKNNSDCHVDIYGYTDRSGGDAINVPLSQKRAQSVADYLTSCGVTSTQLQNIVGKGSQDEIENKTVSQANRRVEVYLYASRDMINKANAGTLQ